MAPSAPNGKKQKTVYCESSPSWNPDTYLADTELHTRTEAQLGTDDLRSAITTSFSLRKTDAYVYHAIVAVTLPEVQHVVSLGSAHGLHNWYYGEPPTTQSSTITSESANGELSSNHDASESNPITSSKSKSNTPSKSKQPPPTRPQPPLALPPPPRADTEAYLSIFSPSNSASTALRNFTSNAKKGSLRLEIGQYLTSKRYIHPSLSSLNKLPRVKPTNPTSPNPYLTFLSWASRALEWAGPSASSARGRPSSHHVLPILMHHFGCACPSYEALEILRVLADGREILDIGSGNGYWTRMLRDYYAWNSNSNPKTNNKSKPKPPADTADPLPTLPIVTPIDSAQSSWRTNWVSDTLIADGAAYLRTTRGGARDTVLLLVYPIVGGGVAGGHEGGFTRGMLDAYDGDTVAVVGTQNHNGYTGFRDMTMDEFMAREHGDEWVKVVQVPLPSFPGKDEALYVFQRGSRAPPLVEDETGTQMSVDQTREEKT